jgi:hypothetical protein
MRAKGVGEPQLALLAGICDSVMGVTACYAVSKEIPVDEVIECRIQVVFAVSERQRPVLSAVFSTLSGGWLQWAGLQNAFAFTQWDTEIMHVHCCM